MKSYLNVLIVEDSEDDALLLLRELRKNGYETSHKRVETPDAMQGALAAGEWDVVLSDFAMPGFSGVAALEMLKANGLDFPFIIVSGKIGEETAVQLMKAGAHDYVAKDNLSRLVPAIEREVKEFTERNRLRSTEMALRESEEKMRLLTSTAVDAITMIDGNGDIAYWNPAAERIFGYPANEALGKSLHHLIAPERYHEVFRKGFKRFRETGCGPAIGKTLEMVGLRKDGKELPVEVSFSVMCLRGERHAIGIIRDISERKRAEEERKKLEAQLRHSQKMETVGRLAGGIAHEFNNMLQAIVGFGHVMQMSIADNDPLQENVSQILAAVDRAANLTRNLLTFSRKQVMTTRITDINEIMIQVENFLKKVIGSDVELRITLAEQQLAIFADSGQIEQVLMNLATNARDALSPGGVLAIETSVAEIDEAFSRDHGYGITGKYALVTVSDNGRGMDEDTRKRIFEPFFTTKEVGKGTGLGLSITYGIIKQHNGYIDVRSEQGTGTVFRIWFPLIEDVNVAKSGGASRSMMGGAETILLAEDDATIRDVVAHVLRDYGYTVITADNGIRAVDRFVEHGDSISLLLFDLVMPKKNGREAYDEIRKLRPGVKCLFITGCTSDLLEQGLLEDGMAVVTKPVSSPELLGKVREMLDMYLPASAG